MTRTAPALTSATTGHRVLSEDDGVLPPGTSVFDDHLPGVANVHRALLLAVRRAAVDAAAEGIDFRVNSGWRSPAYQAQLLRDAVSKSGSRAKAARWVATPERSAHVSGDAIDIGPPRGPRRGCPHTVHGMDCAKSIGTSRGTSNCASTQLRTAPPQCIRTPRTTRG
ncbi:D-alanyl-D-alanine carboxypeptidase family protein [Williamsia muralis]|uniref:D-alanyl-D-alanine carboxypeptidase family protein n=1 Tax=Williamsia marianensis TaxID=85044 RepID=UPI003F5CF967